MNKKIKIALFVAVIAAIGTAAVFADTVQVQPTQTILSFLKANGVNTAALANGSDPVSPAVAQEIRAINENATLGPQLDAMVLSALKAQYDSMLPDHTVVNTPYVQMSIGPLTWSYEHSVDNFS